MEYLVAVLIVFVVLLLSIGLHEVGHMVPAKRFGVRVSHYMVGFGPTLWSRTKGETEYGFKAIPLGGYVRLVGMYPPDAAVGNPPARTWLGRLARDARQASAEEIRPGEDGRAFYHLSTPKKLVVMLGGPVMNLVIAFFLMAIVLVGIGLPTVTTTTSPASRSASSPPTPTRRASAPRPTRPRPAAAAGIEPGDTVVSYDGTEITSWDQLSGLIRATGAEAVPIVVERDGERVDLTITPVVARASRLRRERRAASSTATATPSTEPVGFLGITPAQELVRQSPLDVRRRRGRHHVADDHGRRHAARPRRRPGRVAGERHAAGHQQHRRRGRHRPVRRGDRLDRRHRVAAQGRRPPADARQR